MKNFNLCKRTVSILLCLLMVLSMTMVGIVSTSAAETITVYFSRPTSNWNQSYVKIHYDRPGGGTTWPGINMDYDHTNDAGESVYKATIPADVTIIVFNDNNGIQTNDINSNFIDGNNWYSTSFNNNRHSVDCTIKEPAKWYLKGTFNDWQQTDSELFVDGQKTYSLAANTTYEFKLFSETWYGNSGTMTSDNCTGWTFTTQDGNNCKINTTVAGNYIFNLDTSGNNPTLSVTYPGSEPPTETPTEAPTEAPTPADTMRVFFTCPKDWGDLHVYYEYSGGTSGAYPGGNMTFLRDDDVSGNTIWYVDVPTSTYLVIFNNGKDGYGTDRQKTVDIKNNNTGDSKLEAGYGYYLTGEQDEYGSYKVGRWAEDVDLITYKLAYGSDEVTEEDITPGTPYIASLTAGTKYTFAVNKYVNGNQTATYTSDMEIEDASFDVALSEDATSTLAFTPNETGDYKIVFNKDSMKLSCQMAGTRRIYFQDGTAEKWIGNDDANVTVTVGDETILMKESIDTLSGLKTWYADVDETVTTGYTFKRMPFVGGDAWNTWSAGYNAKPLYKATGNETGSWQANVNVADGSVSNFWAGLYCDTKGNADTADFVRMYENGNDYFLYLPSYVDLKNAKIYSTYYSATIKGGAYTTAKKIYSNTDTSVPYGIENTLNLVNDGTFELKFKYTSGASEQTKTLHVMQTQKTAALLLTTNEELYTGTTAAYYNSDASLNKVSDYKEGITTKGTYSMYSEKGAQIVGDNNKVKKIKGRGNSSFEASMRLYGKYAYNLSLDKKAKFVDGANKSKKWCLLANNADESMLRTTLVFKIAEEVGVAYAPKTRLIDFYDNGKYLGAYVIAEKVEYGGNTMMETAPNGEEVVSLDDVNEDFAGDDYAAIEDKEHMIDNSITVGGQTFTYHCSDYTQYTCGEVPAELYETGDFVLEFELPARYQAEASWFIAPLPNDENGQPVCLKYPEFASEAEMQWIITQFAPMWNAVYFGGEHGDIDAFNAVADISSFSKTYLIQELTMNLDAAATSYYVTGGAHFDKLIAAPVWDYDWSCGDYYQAKRTTTEPITMDNCERFFVADKSAKTDDDDPRKQVTPCFENQLCSMTGFWTENEKQWTNLFVPVLYKYLDTKRTIYNGSNCLLESDDGKTEGILLTELLPAFKSAAEMNESRWNAMNNLEANPGNYWGTKSTAKYYNNLHIGENKCTESTSVTYSNTAYYLNDWLVIRLNTMSHELYNEENKYVFGESSFECTAPDADKNITVTPNLVITQNETPITDIKYTIYVNGKAKGTFDYEEGVGQQVTLSAGTNEVYVEYFPADMTDMKKELDAQEIIIAEPGGEVELTIYFKSSDSLRYLPTVVVDGKEKVMKKGNLIKTNENQTQTFSWYSAKVDAVLGKSLSLKFTNAIGMRATVTVENVSYQPYYFGADNLNTSTEAYDYTTNSAEEPVRNFVRNATNLVYNSSNDISNTSLAYTSIGGTQYVLGDVDGDGELTILDVTAVQKDLAKVEALEGVSKSLGDFLLDGDLSIADGTAIQKFLCKLPF